ncbi:hypothetical protein J7E91_28530 [Streptomyces sp. ISL-99]|uniref:hypothetical protein n=1 Tax=Streptomyces sp. ISL-99 TaxID=2819193 RepID=UPI001BE8CDED|nr:hypothetical protein [Streptomyces sp. ISL-99]MBT2529244.1 hypothetical protein [Streptomyces sp. ISL-99]
MTDGKEQSKPVLEGEACIAGRPETKTDFIDYPLKELKRMLEGVNHGLIHDTSVNWGEVYKFLVGGEGGGIAGLLDKHVKDVQEHWGGEASTAFGKEAAKISTSIRNTAWHADLNRSQMADASEQLRQAKTDLDAIQEPGNGEKFGDWFTEDIGRDGEGADKALARGDKSAEQIAQENESDISSSRFEHLKAVTVMETLGANYMRVTRNLKNNPPKIGDDGTVGEPDRNVEYPPPVSGGGVAGGARPGASGAATKPWSAGPPKGVGQAPEVPRPKGITGGAQLPPTTGTNVDSIKPGLTGPGPSHPGPISGGGGGGGGGGTPGPGLVVPSGSGGGPRPAGTRGGISPVRGGGGRVGGPSVAGGAGRSAGGRPGMGGMGGGAGAGAAGRAGAGTGGRGPLAKARGGVVGAAQGITAKGAGGGAGLHGSRGGMAGGMAGGGMGGRNGRRSGEENERGDRPDYLVEDEETWISEEDRNRNVPRNIE